MCLEPGSLTVGQRLEPRRHRPRRRQVGHVATDAGLVLIEGVLEGSGQVTGLSRRQLRTAGHRPPRTLPPETGNRKGGHLSRPRPPRGSNGLRNGTNGPSEPKRACRNPTWGGGPPRRSGSWAESPGRAGSGACAPC